MMEEDKACFSLSLKTHPFSDQSVSSLRPQHSKPPTSSTHL